MVDEDRSLVAALHRDDKEEEIKQPLMTHLVELRRRLVWSVLTLVAGTAFCFFFARDIYGFLVAPLAAAGGTERNLIYTGLTEAFITYVRVAFFAGAFLTFPIVALQIWRFIAPGLFVKERKVFLPFLIATPALFFAGGLFAYYLVMPMAWHFFLGFESGAAETVLPVHLEARVSEYLDLVMTMIFAFGICFELPVLVTLLGRAGIVSAPFLAAQRKYAIVLIFVVAAVLTPPDVLSQFLLAIPLMGLYEISILLVRHAAAKDL